MKFVVSRTTIGCYERPCDEAILSTIPHVQTLTLESPEEFDLKHPMAGGWFNRGTNHRVNKNGYITRDIGTIDVWTIEINSVDELMDFYHKHGELVITDCWANPSYPEIEIYDGRRE